MNDADYKQRLIAIMDDVRRKCLEPNADAVAILRKAQREMRALRAEVRVQTKVGQ